MPPALLLNIAPPDCPRAALPYQKLTLQNARHKFGWYRRKTLTEVNGLGGPSLVLLGGAVCSF